MFLHHVVFHLLWSIQQWFGIFFISAANLLKNGNFEEGPYVFPNTSWGVLIPPHIEDDHSPLPGWIIESLKAVKYIDSKHYAVPEGSRAIELVAGKESALAQVVFTKPGRRYALTFSVGDGNNGCEGSLVIEAFAGKETVKVPYESKGKGGFKRAKLLFTALSPRTRVMFLSTFYTTSSDHSGSLCGPVIDDVKLLSVRGRRTNWCIWESISCVRDDEDDENVLALLEPF